MLLISGTNPVGIYLNVFGSIGLCNAKGVDSAELRGTVGSIGGGECEMERGAPLGILNVHHKGSGIKNRPILDREEKRMVVSGKWERGVRAKNSPWG